MFWGTSYKPVRWTPVWPCGSDISAVAAEWHKAAVQRRPSTASLGGHLGNRCSTVDIPSPQSTTWRISHRAELILSCRLHSKTALIGFDVNELCRFAQRRQHCAKPPPENWWRVMWQTTPRGFLELCVVELYGNIASVRTNCGMTPFSP